MSINHLLKFVISIWFVVVGGSWVPDCCWVSLQRHPFVCTLDLGYDIVF